MKNAPFLLIINDGWGVAGASRANAITSAHTPFFNHLLKNYLAFTLQASGEAVGLPWGEVGNSEVGHLTLGAGKILYQDLPRIIKSISEGSFFKNAELVGAYEKAKERKGTLHLIGLLSDGGVHSHVEHLWALLELAAMMNPPRIAIHCFLDGRDVGYNTANRFVEDLKSKIKELRLNASIGSIAGRYWAMDRDNHWERIQRAYEAIVQGESEKFFKEPEEALKFYYKQDIYDEQIPPTVITPPAALGAFDAAILFNFRADRMRQITSALSVPAFNKFERRSYQDTVHFVSMTEYDKQLPVRVAFPEEAVTYPLARVFSDGGFRQLHIAETEKYAHVSYFFNGGHEEAYRGEDRILVPSRSVSDWAQAPEMSAREITRRLENEIVRGVYQFIVVNFANADMVGHTGNLRAAIRAVEILDSCMRLLTEAMLSRGGGVLITADHGNAEVMFNSQTGEINKEHTNNPVPCILVGKSFVVKKKSALDLSALTPRGVLADVAPTILKYMGIEIPEEMTGVPFI